MILIHLLFFITLSQAAAFQQGKIPPTPFSAPPPAGAMIPPPPSLRKFIVFMFRGCNWTDYPLILLDYLTVGFQMLIE